MSDAGCAVREQMEGRDEPLCNSSWERGVRDGRERPRGHRGRRRRSSGHTAAAPCGPGEAHGGAGRPPAAHAVGREGRRSCIREDPCGGVPERWAPRYGAVLGELQRVGIAESESSELEGTFEGHLVQLPCSEQGYHS